MSKRSKRSNQKRQEISSVDIKFTNDFLEMIDDFAKLSQNSTAIITVSSQSRGWNQVIDVIDNKNGKPCEWGYQEFYRAIFAAKIANPETYPLSIVVRTFTKERFNVVSKQGKKTILPGKQIRMFYLPSYGEIHQLSAEDCFACMNTDSRTGEVLPLDPTLEYIGSNP